MGNRDVHIVDGMIIYILVFLQLPLRATKLKTRRDAIARRVPSTKPKEVNLPRSNYLELV